MKPFLTTALAFLVIESRAALSEITNFLSATQLPAMGYWTPGIPGGIDQYSTNYTFFCDVTTNIPGTNILAVPDGTTDCTVALNTALRLCPSNKYVYLPAGRYKTTAVLDMRATRPTILRGAGKTKTFIDHYNGGGTPIIRCQSEVGISGWKGLTADARRGDLSVSVSDASAFGWWWWTNVVYVCLQSYTPTLVTNAFTPLGMSYDLAYEPSASSYMIRDSHTTSNSIGANCIAQWLKVTNKVGNTLYFDRPLNTDFWMTNNSDVSWFVSSMAYRSGVEELCIRRHVYPTNSTASTHGILFYGAFECWVKGLESIMAYKWHIQLSASARCEVRDSYIHDTWSGGGDSGYGVGTFGRSGDCLAINNIFEHCRHSMISEYGGMGNVWAYNYSKDPITGDMLASYHWTNGADYIIWRQTNLLSFVGPDMDQHGGGLFELWEGNVAARLCWDYDLASSRYMMAYRNWIQRKSCNVTNNLRAVEAQSYNYSNAILGNVLLTPGQTCDVYDWYKPTTPARGLSVWRFGYLTDGDTSAADTNCLATMIRHLNYDFWTGTNQVTEGLPTDGLPASLFLDSKPDFLSGYGWPVMGPGVSGQTNSALPYPIPAMATYYSAASPDPDPETGSTTGLVIENMYIQNLIIGGTP